MSRFPRVPPTPGYIDMDGDRHQHSQPVVTAGGAGNRENLCSNVSQATTNMDGFPKDSGYRFVTSTMDNPNALTNQKQVYIIQWSLYFTDLYFKTTLLIKPQFCPKMSFCMPVNLFKSTPSPHPSIPHPPQNVTTFGWPLGWSQSRGTTVFFFFFFIGK